jgi:hypothetical protein
MEQRAHPRIQIPLAVEVSHPSLGEISTVARDISEGGLFVQIANARVAKGAKLKVRVLPLVAAEAQPTPTVEMEVKRVTPDGLGLAFVNKTAKHLWATVARMRDELQIGRDYFQIYQSIALIHESRGILTVQHNGKWLLPGHYLTVGQPAVDSLAGYASNELGVAINPPITPVATQANVHASVIEAAAFSVIYTAHTLESRIKLADSSRYTDYRWVHKMRDLREATFAADEHRDIISHLLNDWLNQSTLQATA